MRYYLVPEKALHATSGQLTRELHNVQSITQTHSGGFVYNYII